MERYPHLLLLLFCSVLFYSILFYLIPFISSIIDQDGQGRKQDRRQNQEASSSNRSILARIEGMEAAQPPMELLSRQRAGLVRPHQPHGAFAIQHPDYDPGASQEEQQQQQHHRPSHSDRTTSRSSWMLPDRTDVARSSSTANTNLTSPGRGTTSTTASGTSSSTIPGMDPNTRLSQMLHAELVEVPIRASIFDIDADRLGVLHHERKRKHIRISLVVVLVVVVVVVLVIPLTIVTDRNKQHRREQFPYRCFTSTYDLLKWQIQDYRATNYTTTQNTYRMCPGVSFFPPFFVVHNVIENDMVRCIYEVIITCHFIDWSLSAPSC